MITTRRRLLIVLLGGVVCLGVLLLVWLIGRPLAPRGPVLIYGYRTEGLNGDIVVYDPVVDETRVLFSGGVAPDSDYFWSPDRSALLRATLDPGVADQADSAFTFTLYANWLSDPVALPGRFDGYSTPAWAPDGQTVIVPACQVTPPDIVCATYVFYRIEVADPQLLPIDLPDLAGLPRTWAWADDDTLLVWRGDGLLRLELESGAAQTLVDGLLTQPRNLYWTPDRSRLAYQTTLDAVCLHVLVLADGAPQTVACGDIATQTPFGWLPDGTTLFYVRGDADEVRLYDSQTQTERSAAQPPVTLTWSLDALYSLPGTDMLIRHGTFGGLSTTLIDVTTGQARDWPLDLRNPSSDGRFVPALNGAWIAVLQREHGRLDLVTPDDPTPQFIHGRACCTLVWD